MPQLEAILEDLTGVAGVDLSLGQSDFINLAAAFAGQSGSVVLLSGGDLDCARYHLLAADPWLILSGGRTGSKLQYKGQDLDLDNHPLQILKKILSICRLPDDALPEPVCAGLFGYLAYDLKDCLENLPRTALDDLGLPGLYLMAPRILVIYDKQNADSRLWVPRFANATDSPSPAEQAQRLQALAAAPLERPRWQAAKGTPVHSNFQRGDYLAAIDRIIDYIAAGDVYQVNMSQRFETAFDGDAFALFQHLFQINPAPFFAYVNAGDHQIVSTSPERFLKRTGAIVETRPIKGTRPRGTTPLADQTLRRELAESPKDDAELSMIVDLLRNDLGRVCQGGSVRVAQHKRVEAYQNVYHLVSIVQGRLAQGCDSADLIAATFPGGSITGCPKIRAMQIIDELEPQRRHVYTGAVGYIGLHDTMDLSVAIRTATIAGGRIYFSVGGGIVFDSKPEEEFEETLHKGRTLLDALKVAEPPPETAWVWLNGRLMPLARATIPVSDLGLQYGFGFFETIRVEQGRPRRLAAHLARFETTWKALFGTPPPDITWPDVIAQVIARNRLGEGVAAAKLLATRGDPHASEGQPTLLVTIREYHHRLQSLAEPGLHLGTYPQARQSPLAAYKTLNYLYYHLAGRWALQNGFDEALVLNPDGSVSETHRANLLLVHDRTVICPQSATVLPGIMAGRVSEILSSWGYSIAEEKVMPSELVRYQVLATNALMGTVAVLRVDHRQLPSSEALCRNINATLGIHP